MNPDNNKKTIREAAEEKSLQYFNSLEQSAAFFSFEEGAYWQKQKDKEVINKLIGLLKRASNWYSNENNYPVGTQGYTFYEEAKQLLNSIKVS